MDARRRNGQRPLLGFKSRSIAVITVLLVAGCAIAPQPLSRDELRTAAAIGRKAAQAEVPPLTGKLTLDEALARGLKYNLEHRSRMMEQALAVGQLDLSRYDMLPKLLASAGYYSRDNENISRSTDSVTGQPSLANPYISSDRTYTYSDFGLTWNLLDFGVSYYNAKQNADRVLIAAERRRKAMHLLMQDIRTAFWRAASAQKLHQELRNTIALAESALADARKAEAEKIRNPMDALRYQRSVLENLRVLESIDRELSSARIELAALINLDPGMPFQVAEPEGADLAPAFLDLPIDKMEETAVVNNADVREQLYNARIAVDETRKALLKLLPGLSFNYTYKHNDNSYLINNNWREAAAQVSWNLFSLLSAPTTMKHAASNEALAEHRRITAQMAALAQVHLAKQHYESAYHQFERADAIWQIDQKLFEHTANREAAETQSRLDRISSNTAAILSLLRRYQALSQVYAASSRVQSVLGLEPAVGSVSEASLPELVQQVSKASREWSQGEFRQAPPKAEGSQAPAVEPARQ